jgi:cell division protease FtsH
MANENNKKKNPISIYWIYGFLGLALISFATLNSPKKTFEINSKETFLSLAADGYVSKVEIIKADSKFRIDFVLNEKGKNFIKNSQRGEFKKMKKIFQGKNNTKTTEPVYELNIVVITPITEQISIINENLKKEHKAQIITSEKEEVDYFGGILGFLLPIIILVAIYLFVMRRMSGGSGAGGGSQIFNIGKSKAKMYEKGKSTNKTFKDVAGLQEAKVEIQEIVEFLKSPKKYTDLGAKIPKGALLVGPPGTGKTLLAKAVAGEAQVPFFALSGSDFVEMFVGVGASRVRDLFKQAKEKAPSIIFIDEIDAIGRARGKGNGYGSNDERENTLNQLLTEMDGFETNSGVIILAATNRSDVLDAALTRAGRFDRQIFVDMPDINERKEIFQVHLKPLKLDEKIDIDFLSKQTPGFSGADIANLCNEAALIAARNNKIHVEKQDFLDAVDRIVGGLEKKNKIITKEEKRSIAFHEAGHATISWMLEYANPLIKVTIVPRGNSLGAAWYLPEERSITTTEQILDDMCSALGGRAAEKLTFGKISTGALSDLEKVTKQAYAMVSIYGLNERVGNISFYDSRGNESFTKPYSDATANMIDEEVSKLIESQYERALEILTVNQDKLILLAEKLLESEVIFKEDLEAIFGKRKWGIEETPLLVDEEIFEDEKTEEETSVQEETKSEESISETTSEENVNTDTTIDTEEK